ncbi:MAG: hypothetical protein ACYCX9_04550 [Candidatus Dormibacteria bacterium]
MPSHEADPLASPLPQEFLDQLSNHEEVLVSSRDASGTGRVAMWFAISPRGYVYLLTPSFSLKAQRWQADPWVRLTIPNGGPSQAGVVRPVGSDDLGDDLPLILSRFAMSGAVTAEALAWMLESGSHMLLRVEGAG